MLGAVVATAAVAVAGAAVSRGGGTGGTVGEAGGDAPATAGAGDCTDLPYQPCGEPPAPHTDGASCIDDHDDYDGIAANGCEAAPDDHDGERIDGRIEANIVPRDDVDTYVLELDDGIQRLCDGTIEVRLEAPRGMVLDLELRDHLGIVDRATSVDGAPAVVRLTEERCGADDRTTYDVVVRATGDARVADDYVLTREGGF